MEHYTLSFSQEWLHHDGQMYQQKSTNNSKQNKTKNHQEKQNQ